MNCLFCKIAKGEIPAKVVSSDERVVAFEDISPQAPVHVLIIPRKHIATIMELEDGDNDLMGHMVQVAKKIAIEKGIDEGGFRLVINCNSDAGQAVFHIHLHVLGGRVMNWPPG